MLSYTQKPFCGFYDGPDSSNDGLVHAWPFLADYGTRWYDVRGKRDLTTGAAVPTWVSGPYGLSPFFVPAGAHQGIGGTRAVLNTGLPFTLIGVARLETFSTGSYPVLLNVPTNTGAYSLSVSNQTAHLGLLCGSDNAAWCRVKSDHPAATWVGVDRVFGIVYNGNGPTVVTNFTGYIDGVPCVMNASGAFGGRSSEIVIGADGVGGGNRWNGRVDACYIYNRALNFEEMKSIAADPWLPITRPKPYTLGGLFVTNYGTGGLPVIGSSLFRAA